MVGSPLALAMCDLIQFSFMRGKGEEISIEKIHDACERITKEGMKLGTEGGS